MVAERPILRSMLSTRFVAKPVFSICLEQHKMDFCIAVRTLRGLAGLGEGMLMRTNTLERAWSLHDDLGKLLQRAAAIDLRNADVLEAEIRNHRQHSGYHHGP